MARRIYLLVPSAIACVIFGCGGASDSGLFSAGGGKSGVSSAGAAAASSADAGSSAATVDTSSAGSIELGGDDAGGDSAGGNSTAGSETGGTGAGEAGHSGSAGSVDQAGTGGGSAGHAEGGSAGHAEGGAGTGGTGTAGSAGSGGKTGSAGAAGGGNEPTCSQLLAEAATELATARVCNVALNAEQCTGKVETTCNCQVPVEKDDSAATKAYQATLKQIQVRHCVQACPAIACTPVIDARCRVSTPGSFRGTCDVPLTPGQL